MWSKKSRHYRDLVIYQTRYQIIFAAWPVQVPYLLTIWAREFYILFEENKSLQQPLHNHTLSFRKQGPKISCNLIKITSATYPFSNGSPDLQDSAILIKQSDPTQLCSCRIAFPKMESQYWSPSGPQRHLWHPTSSKTVCSRLIRAFQSQLQHFPPQPTSQRMNQLLCTKASNSRLPIYHYEMVGTPAGKAQRAISLHLAPSRMRLSPSQ